MTHPVISMIIRESRGEVLRREKAVEKDIRNAFRERNIPDNLTTVRA